ncbi:helix-turn-helix domain-containing protein [Phytomonospora sp. NPDC050363]|uniref:TetR/AcrR family transcriptional regulator n=1 Tax=Phytomonospora sp. NPDC050363 TaxID=3155642 RepID=UPI0033E1F25D
MAGRGQPGKRGDILRGALTVFARDGYVGASIDAISAEASVSTRTIYNHFQDKAALFVTVVEESTARVAGIHGEIIERHLGREVFDVEGLEEVLVACAVDLADPAGRDYGEHIALIRHLDAEAGSIPAEAVRIWRRTGPLRVQELLAGRLAEFGARGLLGGVGVGPGSGAGAAGDGSGAGPVAGAGAGLSAEAAGLAATHFLMLARGAVPFRRREGEAGIEDAVRAGVRVFLYGYARG